MAAVLLDTTVLIDLLRGRGRAEESLRALREAGDSVRACAINVEETVRGRRAEHEAAQTIFSRLRIIPLGERDGARASVPRATRNTSQPA